MSELEIPIFPLPDVVFFPETVLPLHVFEPRYRQLVADCLAGSGRLAVVMLRAGWERDYQGRPPVHAVAGAGEIIHSEILSDGRYNILLDGQMRIRIETELPPGPPYRVARAHPLRDVMPDPGMLAERLGALRSLYRRLLETLGQAQADVVGRLTVAGAGPGAAVDRIVSAVIADPGVRQRILETTDVSDRLDLALAALGEILTAVGEDGLEAEEGEERDA